MQTACFIVGSYLLGAIPFGLLIGWMRGVDVRTRGSCNIGATNVGRVVGRRWGYACLALDILKGFAPALAASLTLVGDRANPHDQLALLLVAIAAVLGHVFPVYLGFRGGKGVATTVGVALGIWPYFTIPMALSLIVYAAVRFTTGMVSAGSLLLAISFPAALFAYLCVRGLALADHWPLQVVSVLLGLMIIIRHRENIRRLLGGRELDLEGDSDTDLKAAAGQSDAEQ